MQFRLRILLSSGFLLLCLLHTFSSSVYAATFRSGDSVTITAPLSDLYVAGNSVTVTAPITHDLVAAGESLHFDAPVSGGVIAAGNTLRINSPISDSLRAAGNTITVNAPVARDVLLFGNRLRLTEQASISGDLVVNGGTISIESPVRGNVFVNGGSVTINSQIGGNVEGHTEQLVLGSNAVINGNLAYTAPERAIIRDGAVITGIEDFKQQEKGDAESKKIAGLFTSFSLYKLFADSIAGLLLIYFLYSYAKRSTDIVTKEPMKSGLLGLAVLILGPIIGLALLLLIIPGIVTLLLYGVILFVAAVISKLLVGKMILTWWYGRQRKSYTLDWKAAVIGPITMFLLLLIPIIGWFIGFLFYLGAIGGLVWAMLPLISSPENNSGSSVTVKQSVIKKNRSVTSGTKKVVKNTRKKRS